MRLLNRRQFVVTVPAVAAAGLVNSAQAAEKSDGVFECRWRIANSHEWHKCVITAFDPRTIKGVSAGGFDIDVARMVRGIGDAFAAGHDVEIDYIRMVVPRA